MRHHTWTIPQPTIPPPSYFLRPSEDEDDGDGDEDSGSSTSPFISSSLSFPLRTTYTKARISSIPPYARQQALPWLAHRLSMKKLTLRRLILFVLASAGATATAFFLLYLGTLTSTLIPVSPLFWLDSKPENGSLRPSPIMAHSLFTADCLEAWVARGELCESLDLRSVAALDAVWSWVNGSDPRHQASRSFWSDKAVGYAITAPQAPSDMLQDPDEQRAEAQSGNQQENGTPSRPQAVKRLLPPAPGVNSRPMAKPKIAEKWFRDHDELRYSMRSVYQHMSPYIRTAHLLAADFAHPFVAPAVLDGSSSSSGNHDLFDEEGHVNSSRLGYSNLFASGEGELREGQWPQWLDADSEWTRQGQGGVRLHHHWNLFTLPLVSRRREAELYSTDPQGENREQDELVWKSHVLPTFNSFAIESQMPNIPGLADNFIYNNDDFFLGLDLSPSDFFSPLYGTVFRMLGDLRVNPKEDSTADPSGEWQALERSSWVLSERFGLRKRPYVTHVTKTFSTPLLHETRLMFPEAFAMTATHRFRGKDHDVVAVFLMNHMTVERHREALLWSFIVARGDRDADGFLDSEEMEELMKTVQQASSEADQGLVKVNLPFRKTLYGDRLNSVLKKAGFPRPEHTMFLPSILAYKFSSRDGYPYIDGLTMSNIDRESRYPDLLRGGASQLCTFQLNQCFPEMSGSVEASALLKKIAFETPRCGDCLIFHLMNLSGDLGLSAFLPPTDSHFPVNISAAVLTEPTPFLPLASTWSDLDFSLTGVASQTGWPRDSRREFSMRLIQRYSYVMGSLLYCPIVFPSSPMQFATLKSPTQAVSEIGNLKEGGNAFICVNDDITGGHAQIDKTFSSWLQKTFPAALPFEIPRPS
ncbi:hypothetical protein EW146_g4612 [Bondarzewia mesenterica]|uniref:EF-hand domain-containing protein n=1 Tax=Bondarzewia mesenterica TaxID=1095465 RepID=A0A4S4LUJ0_9AGAM|nr:hypothetical protein EW146_g4612 [Bondarzewia mesenterica]